MSEKYAALKLPDLADLLKVPLLPEPQRYWTRIPKAAYQAMTQAASGLRHTQPDLWLCNLMLRHLGLRNKELAHAERSWLIEHGEGWALAIEDRPTFQLKGVRPRILPLHPDLAALLLEIDSFFILLHGNKTDRLEIIERTHNTWLRQFIPDRVKGNHELRKHAGSMVFTKQGLPAAQRFLGHFSQSTTEKWYATYLQDLPTITFSDEAAL